MREKICWLKEYLESGEDGFLIFLSWAMASSIVGLTVGLVGIAFHVTLEFVTSYRTAHPAIIFLLPLAGLAIVFLYRILHMEKDKGTNFILMAVRANEEVTFKTAPLIFISTVLTHFFGGSAGREGAALQIGGSIASSMGRWAKMNEKDERIMTMCGMSAGFAALFGTPIAAVVFSMEVITVGVMHYSAMVPCVISALVAAGLSYGVGIAPAGYTLLGVPEMSLNGAWSVGILGIFCAVLSIVFCLVMEKTGAVYRRFLPNAYLRIFIGGCIVIGVTLLLGTRDYNGAGMDVIARAMRGHAETEAFLLKIILTALTLGAGYKGGEIVPSFFIGATFGCVAGPLLGLSPSFAAGLGMAALFCGVTNCPLASLILCLELFGMEGIGYYALVCAISYMLSGYYGLYSEQKIMYSKMKPEFINKKVH
ncbi:chloride channel protein [Anaerotignum lactatifermentans]|uniref:chloride channel protein n=1 Tax=Anaerotignum lactatifermentans TaxID=160404 RepID=UPI002ED37D09